MAPSVNGQEASAPSAKGAPQSPQAKSPLPMAAPLPADRLPHRVDLELSDGYVTSVFIHAPEAEGRAQSTGPAVPPSSEAKRSLGVWTRSTPNQTAVEGGTNICHFHLRSSDKNRKLP